MPVSVPTRDPSSLGPALSNTRAPAANELSAIHVENLKDVVIEHAEAINDLPYDAGHGQVLPVTNAAASNGTSDHLARGDHSHALGTLVGANFAAPVLRTESADLGDSGLQIVPAGLTSGGDGGGVDIAIGPGVALSGPGKGVSITGGTGAANQDGGTVSVDAGGSNGGGSVGGNVRVGRENSTEVLIGNESGNGTILLDGEVTITGGLDMGGTTIGNLPAPTSAGTAATKSYVDQPPARSVSGTTDTIVAGDIGGVVMYSQAGGVTVSVPDLSSSLVAGKVLILTLQGTNAATVITVDPGASVTIDGSASNFVAATGKSRVSLISVDGLNWYSGTP